MNLLYICTVYRYTSVLYIVLTAVWIKSGEEDRCTLDGHDITFQPRPDNQTACVVIYIASELSYTYRLILLPAFEIINVVSDVKYNNTICRVTLYGIYRQCKRMYSKFENDFENILKSHLTQQ